MRKREFVCCNVHPSRTYPKNGFMLFLGLESKEERRVVCLENDMVVSHIDPNQEPLMAAHQIQPFQLAYLVIFGWEYCVSNHLTLAQQRQSTIYGYEKKEVYMLTQDKLQLIAVF